MSDKISGDIIVNTTHGPIRGHQSQSVYDETYFSFEKVPFAKPPLGELRFKAPLAVEPWQDVLDCTKKAMKPLQKNLWTNNIEGSEDCLYLNIYTKKLKSDKLLPVVIFIFGGGFERGDPTRDLHGPDYFMMKDVVLVTIAYRVGPLGFLSLEDPAAGTPGNAGLKDQLLGLKWISQNIVNFNGDPSNVTLSGESAGAASTHYMMLSPLAKGLFHKAILMSGNVLCPWALSTLKKLPYRLAKSNNFEADTDKDILEFLQKASAEDLLRPYLLTKEENLNDNLFAFGPVIEPYESPDCIIPKHPSEMLATAWGNEIPVVMSGTSFEGLLMYGRVHMAPFLLTELNANHQHMLPLELKIKHDLERQRELASRLRDAHFQDVKELSLEHALHYCEYASYKVFWHPILRTIQTRLRYSKAPTFLYRFDFDSPNFNHQRIKYCGKELRGVAHVDDHSYIFYGDFSWKLSQDTPEYKTIKTKIDIWTNFAENSVPSCEQLEGTQWKPLSDTSAVHCLNIGEQLKVIDLPEMEKLKIWDSIYEEN